MKKAIIWGTGDIANAIANLPIWDRELELVAAADNNSEKWGMIWNPSRRCKAKIIPPAELNRSSFDILIICTARIDEIIDQIHKEIGISEKEIISYQELNDNFRRELLEKLYKKYEHTTNSDIQDIIATYRHRGFSIYGSYAERAGEKYLVSRDNTGMPYIKLEGKRLYYPRDKHFRKIDGKECVYDVIHEHKDGSPHQYIKQPDDIIPGSVVVDAGTCEGNFALRYIDKIKKAYLIEADSRWMEALERTFKPYTEKVIFCNKYLTSYNSKQSITLDTLVKDKIDFLKMDIEGEETEALLGGKNILRMSQAKCAICSYHRQTDESNIRFILEACGYKTSVSKGYMCFVYDPNFMDTLDFRRGMVYGEKG